MEAALSLPPGRPCSRLCRAGLGVAFCPFVVTLVGLFASVGVLVGEWQMAYSLKAPAHPKHWWCQHMVSMLGGCIAALTACLVVNAAQLGTTTFARAVWLAPTCVGVPATIIWTRYYRRRVTPP